MIEQAALILASSSASSSAASAHCSLAWSLRFAITSLMAYFSLVRYAVQLSELILGAIRRLCTAHAQLQIAHTGTPLPQKHLM